MKNELEGKDYEHLIADGWIMTTEQGDKVIKWVLENKRYNYRIFLYSRRKDSQMSNLLYRLNCDVQRNKISVPYGILTRFIYPKESKQCVNV